jgi:nitrite reductase/ring-hydroxylating ferredoxin subunit
MSEQRPPEEHIVGPASDFPPGTQKLVKVRNIELGIFNVAGQFYALPNICPHQYGPLCTGTLGGQMICNASTNWRFQWQRDGEILTCPWHGMEFDLTTGQALAPAKYRVRLYPVRVVDGEVRVRLRGTT